MFGQNAQRTGRDEPAHTLTVTSMSPDSGVTTATMVTVSPADNAGESSGTTQFTRTYFKGTKATLKVRKSVGGNQFKHWSKNGEAKEVLTPSGEVIHVSSETVIMEPTVTVTMDEDYTLLAV